MHPLIKSLAIVSAMLASPFLGHAQILEYSFEGNATNSGTGGSLYNLTTTNGTYTTGVGGQGQALNLSANPVGGAATTFGTATGANLPSQTAITMAGWLNVDEAFTSSQSVILRNTGAASTGFILSSSSVSSDVGRLGLQVGNGTANTTIRSNANSFGTSGQIGRWVFFAISWDLATGSYAWYRGTETTSVTLINSGTTVIGSMAATSTPIFNLGRSNSALGSYSGSMDELNMYGTALDSTQLESLRQSAIPEPGTYALLALSGLLVILRRRHLKRAQYDHLS